MCQGHRRFTDAKAMLVAAIELAKKQREPVIEVVVELVLKGVDVRGKEPGELFKAAQAFNAPGHNLLRYGWDAWELYALHEGVSPDLASLGRSVMREWYSHSWGRFSEEVGFSAAESMIRQAKDNPEKVEERWEFLLSEEWMVE
ncbi:TPA: hypothetical protein IDY25_003908 [Escherichia coli]|nr:hypothetical protein [Salmonella enterica subsp. enterica serovar Poona]EAT0699457.1 hypothetical protein [Salmonella enterica]EBV5176526.1 hypothetical protein [Salmonella enterica subsp. enterica serovar Carmel]ECE0367178.1 hypothetical protein [Salmonella enterica subsp. enterica]EDI3226234.1 hypothetical protein [Salmonella enterica subsp. enterica serovar Newport]EDR7497912.1 hypothetical protein [Salmonella enterica subsp. enterica serovar Kiambu]EDW8204756.1 hypothetical protein [Sa